MPGKTLFQIRKKGKHHRCRKKYAKVLIKNILSSEKLNINWMKIYMIFVLSLFNSFFAIIASLAWHDDISYVFFFQPKPFCRSAKMAQVQESRNFLVEALMPNIFGFSCYFFAVQLHNKKHLNSVLRTFHSRTTFFTLQTLIVSSINSLLHPFPSLVRFHDNL